MLTKKLDPERIKKPASGSGRDLDEMMGGDFQIPELDSVLGEIDAALMEAQEYPEKAAREAREKEERARSERERQRRFEHDRDACVCG